MQKDTGRYATSQKLVTCLTSTDNLLTTDTTLSYVAPTAAVQDKQVAANAELKVWVDAVKAAKGRTSDDLGTKYPKISEQLWTAVQAALSGSEDARRPRSTAAQATAAARDQVAARRSTTHEHRRRRRRQPAPCARSERGGDRRRTGRPGPARRRRSAAAAPRAVGGLGVPRPGRRSTCSPSTPIRCTATST